jgi:hypothetical protein
MKENGPMTSSMGLVISYTQILVNMLAILKVVNVMAEALFIEKVVYTKDILLRIECKVMALISQLAKTYILESG